jgi:hypothetical protein
MSKSEQISELPQQEAIEIDIRLLFALGVLSNVTFKNCA